MTVVVKTHNEQEEQELIAFLESKKYDFSTEQLVLLTKEQELEILKRDKDLMNGTTSSRPWDEIKRDLQRVYP